MGARHFTAEPLGVRSELVGQPFASPFRRGVAFAIDVAVSMLPSVAVALLAVAAILAVKDSRGLRALWALSTKAFQSPPAKDAAYLQTLKDLAPLMVRLDAEGLPREVRDAVDQGDLDGAAEALSKKEILVAMALGEHAEPEVRGGIVRFPLEHLIPKTLRGLAAYGVAAVYFTLLTSSGGRTLGKRIAGIRVVRIDGERLSLLESLERFVGYLHIPGSLGLSLLYLWHDRNRRLPHDRVANTVGVRAPRSR